MISYAQNYEDVLLARALRAISEGFYIDVGAMDPEEGSVTRHFYDVGWSGINIEPDQRFHNKLMRERQRDINLNVAVGAAVGPRTFYRFDEQGLSTFDAERAAKLAAGGRNYAQQTVQVTTLAAVCREHARADIHFLKIDAEGHEAPIIEGADWTSFRPWILIVEATAPFSREETWHAWEPQVLAGGYRFVYFDGLNRWYICQEKQELASAFSAPPNVLDHFQPHAQVRAEHDRDRFRREAEEARAAQNIVLSSDAATVWERLASVTADDAEDAVPLRVVVGEFAERAVAEQKRTAACERELAREKQRADEYVRAYLAERGRMEEAQHRLAWMSAALAHLEMHPLDVAAGELRLEMIDAPARGRKAERMRVLVKLVNGTRHLLTCCPPHPLHLTYHWWSGDAVAVFEGVRTQLLPFLPAGAESVYGVDIQCPAEPGSYTLEVTVVQEGAQWFDRGLAGNRRARIEIDD